MRTVSLPDGTLVPALGQGTWCMAENPRLRSAERDALACGIELGMTLIDTAEMYGDGAAEELVGEVIGGRREQVFLVSKVLPENGSRQGTIAACERSLRRLGTDRIDLYLLHWRGSVPLEETVSAFMRLKRDGKIRYWGVSNFDVSDMEELVRLDSGAMVATNQVLYNLRRRGIEYDLLPWSVRRQMPTMAYSPIEQGRLVDAEVLKEIADKHMVTPAQVALSWVLRREDVIAIPKAARIEHVRQNRAALDLVLNEEDLARLDEAYPPPKGPVPLEMI
ncbi:MAG TPA: aldo/keto reductase [Noviherbaspirillum sp.]|nr:aldo/keto reductase [Noviherbaspirillum sp.]